MLSRQRVVCNTIRQEVICKDAPLSLVLAVWPKAERLERTSQEKLQAKPCKPRGCRPCVAQAIWGIVKIFGAPKILLGGIIVGTPKGTIILPTYHIKIRSPDDEGLWPHDFILPGCENLAS